MNTFQTVTKSGKPVINKQTKLPEFNRSVHSRINHVKSQLGYINNKPNHNQIWASICTSVTILTS